MMAPKHKSNDAGNSNMPKQSCKMLPLSKKVYVQEKTVYIGFGTICGFRNPLVDLKCILQGLREEYCVFHEAWKRQNQKPCSNGICRAFVTLNDLSWHNTKSFLWFVIDFLWKLGKLSFLQRGTTVNLNALIFLSQIYRTSNIDENVN